MSKTADVIKGIKQLRKEVAEIRADLHQTDRFTGMDEGLLNEKLKKWTNRVYEQLKAWGLKTEAEEGFGRNSIVNHYEGVDRRAKMRDDKLNALLDDILAHPEHYEERLAARPQETTPKEEKEKPKVQKVFLGHGNNKLWARVHMYLKDELHLDVEAWESNPRTGFHSVDVLKTVLDSCGFAVIVATGEDATAEGGLRARQNVVHEIGLFQGRLGFEKVALLQQRSVEGFSNLAGLQVIPFSDSRVEETFYELRRMLERETVIS
jgi:predicted nucleotide-binding protein